MDKFYKIGEISKLYSIGSDSLRYYEKMGILNPERTESGYRLYSIHDIWKLNIIRDLRESGFSMKQIKDFLSSHDLKSTVNMLCAEKDELDKKIKNLMELRENVSDRINIINNALNIKDDEIIIKTLPERRCFIIEEGYSYDEEMDVLIKRLINMDKENLYIIGNNQIGTAISAKASVKNNKLKYESVFVIDKNGNDKLPAGRYLSIFYKGKYTGSEERINRLIKYAEENSIKLKGNFLEILHIDIHITSKTEEFITELQILTEEKED